MECRLDENEPSGPAAGPHISTVPSVVVFLVGPASQLRRHLNGFPKKKLDARHVAGPQLHRPDAESNPRGSKLLGKDQKQVHPQNDKGKFGNILLRLCYYDEKIYDCTQIKSEVCQSEGCSIQKRCDSTLVYSAHS